MKTWFVILCLFIPQMLLAECDKSEIVQCADKKLLDDKCELIAKIPDSKRKIRHLQSCCKSETCLPDINYCIPRRILKRWDNEKCNYNEECNTDICTNNRCAFIPNEGDCSKNKDVCSNKSYCHSKDKCKPLIKENQDCTGNDNGCDFPLICGEKAFKGGEICIKMFSLENDSFATNPLLCASGFSADKMDSQGSYCAESSSTVMECNEESDCTRTITFTGTTTEDTIGTCTCSARGKKAYCEITTEKEEWKAYIKLYKEFILTTFDDDQNVRVLRSVKLSNNIQEITWMNAEIIQATSNVYNYARFREADECAIRFYTSSNSIAISVFIFLLINIILF